MLAIYTRQRLQRIEAHSSTTKRHFARFQDNQKHHVTEGGREQSTNTSREPGIRLHQSRHRHTGNSTCDYSADCHPVRNNEMLKIDKCSYDEERNKNPVRDRHLPWKTFPDCQEK